MSRKILLVAIILILTFSISSFAQEDDMYTVNLSVNAYPVDLYDKVQEMPVSLWIYNDRTIAPVRYIFELFDLKLNWNPSDKSITTVTKEGKNIRMELGSKNIRVDDTLYKMDVAPMLINNRTYIPIKYLFDVLGVKYKWNGETKTVAVDTNLINDFKLPLYIKSTLIRSEKISDKEYMFFGSKDTNKKLYVDMKFINIDDAKVKLFNSTGINISDLKKVEADGYSYNYYNVYYNYANHTFLTISKNNKVYYFEFTDFSLEDIKIFLNAL
ncbi:copper amine oxidase N-terminal domain-containing protein [Helicovermis profundi]|uniref:Copper amine oxidase-like N-terminal domain-containing protein n=1 Tax=Helicovermis profundi TaxID=3065157 RepID=A0AAU9E5R3_9FIRM|nr:hypothetical protein HLPR_17460 [Clostridia bacterium S502]